MKYLIITFLLSTIALTSISQNYIGGNGGITYPIGDFDHDVDMGYSADFEYKYFINKGVFIGAKVGFNYFRQSDFWLPTRKGEYNMSFWMIPINFTGSVILNDPYEDANFYGGLGVGLYLIDCSGEFEPYTTDLSKVDYKRVGEKLGFSPHIGMLYKITKRQLLNIAIEYNHILNVKAIQLKNGVNNLNFKVGVLFKLGK